mmetsp:Transcript_11874/g.22197  ORF Transcript_11874/g.22197 Transcript_11874/m.22197 type:complete len:231 (-) Transcript_11874:479-1171(-)
MYCIPSLLHVFCALMVPCLVLTGCPHCTTFHPCRHCGCGLDVLYACLDLLGFLGFRLCFLSEPVKLQIQFVQLLIRVLHALLRHIRPLVCAVSVRLIRLWFLLEVSSCVLPAVPLTRSLGHCLALGGGQLSGFAHGRSLGIAVCNEVVLAVFFYVIVSCRFLLLQLVAPFHLECSRLSRVLCFFMRPPLLDKLLCLGDRVLLNILQFSRVCFTIVFEELHTRLDPRTFWI